MPVFALKLNLKPFSEKKNMLYSTCICFDIAVVADIFLKGESERMFCVKSCDD